MAREDYEKKNKIIFNMPSTAKLSSQNESIRGKELKDRLMKLIIDTTDEAIELKVGGDHYRRVGIHDEWRQVDINDKKATYFSYQEKAAKDFIYRFNKCGILSDQVGMGKTIEAGMIITELAYRKELGSLLILVPNENMSEKWEVELARKFGFRNYYKDLDVVEGKEEHTIPVDDLPKVTSIKSENDVYAIIFDAYDEIRNGKNTLNNKIRAEARKVFPSIVNSEKQAEIRHIIDSILERNKMVSSKEFKMMVLNELYAPLIREFVKRISENLGYAREFNASHYAMSDTGVYYHIVDMNLDTDINTSIMAEGIIDRLVDKDLLANSLVGEFTFIKAPKGAQVIRDINDTSKRAKSGADKAEYVQTFKDIAHKIKQQYAILIVSKIVGEGEHQKNLLNIRLNDEFESDATKYCSETNLVEKGYFLIDLLIEMSYKTLIVDEAHDYINVSHKQHMRDDIVDRANYEERQKLGIEFSDIDLTNMSGSDGYFVFPLYDDYYFVKKDCLYLKVKALADRSFRKIFMTATPIKSDMIDFYLLYLLADNSDISTNNKIRRIIDASGYDISNLSNLILSSMLTPQKREMNYVTHEGLVIKYTYKYYTMLQDTLEGNTFEQKIRAILDTLGKEQKVNKDIVAEICVNDARKQFQETFTIKNPETGKEEGITSISDLVSSDEGIEHWQNMYSQIGIRSTRHQTYKLDDEHLQLINKVQRDKYRNLPVWSRRNGTIFYINKRDSYIDLIIKERLQEKKNERLGDEDDEEAELRAKIIDIPKTQELEHYKEEYETNVQNINEESDSDVIRRRLRDKEKAAYENNVMKVETKYKPKETALEIYNYINEQLTGTLNESYYYSTDVDYDEFKLHLIAALMTDGVIIEGQEKPKKIDGKVLLFVDEATQNKVLNWLRDNVTHKKMSDAEIEEYRANYKHPPLWYYNEQHAEDDKWIITTDIRSLKEKKGNYLIVVEPNKYEEGVDLQSSNRLINFDIKFCPLKMEQRIGRIDRVKLSVEQPELDIISFTPLNDMSGFMVDFLANDLKMFSCWRGDTTGIVSMPLGTKPNSATFEDIILNINDAYKALYSFNGKDFLGDIKKIATLSDKFADERFVKFNEFIKNEDRILQDMEYLRNNSHYIDNIIYNTTCSSFDGVPIVVFGDLKSLSEQRAVDYGEMDRDSFTNHKNSYPDLIKYINEYYDYNIKSLDKIVNSMNVENKIDTGGQNGQTNRLNVMMYRLKEVTRNYEAFKESKLGKLSNNSYITKEELDKLLEPIITPFKRTVNMYLDQLLSLFDYFCENVRERSKKMTRFISYLTIEEFRVMAGNYE